MDRGCDNEITNFFTCSKLLVNGYYRNVTYY